MSGFVDGVFRRWVSPWKRTVVEMEHGNEQRWVRWYEQQAHCEKCSALHFPRLGPPVGDTGSETR